MKTKYILKVSFKGFLVLIMTLLLAEGFLRVINHLKFDTAGSATEQYFKTLNLRMYRAWFKTKQESPFLPPFQVYSDTGWDNSDRLASIYKNTALPKNQSWVSHDFLQAEERRDFTRYAIHSNDLGFRGQSYRLEKKSGLTRIISLGDYHTFGHGVEDDQTYSSQLEKKLNANFNGKKEFEVWNGGRHAATAIIGLARLKNEIFNFKPDILIVDYGFVDPLVWGDNFMPLLRLPDQLSLLKILVYPLLPIFAHSSVIQSVQNRLILKYWRERSSGYQKTIEQILLLAAEKNIPVILVRELENHFEDSVFSALVKNPNVFVVDAKILLQQAASLGDQEPSTAGSWIEEVPPVARHEMPFEYWSYRLDYFQLNKRGHGILADALSIEIAKILAENSLSKKYEK